MFLNAILAALEKKITYSPGYIGNLDLANVLAKHWQFA